MMVASTSLPLLFFGLAAGALADMFDRTKLMLLAQGVMGGSAAAMAVFTATGAITPGFLLGLGFVLGTGVALNLPTWQALLPEMVPRGLIASAVALQSAAFNVARAIGPALGGLVYAAFGAAVALSEAGGLGPPRGGVRGGVGGRGGGVGRGGVVVLLSQHDPGRWRVVETRGLKPALWHGAGGEPISDQARITELMYLGEDDRLHGIITDRDIVVSCIADGRNPAEVKAKDCAQGSVQWVDSGTDVDEVLNKMQEHQIKRMPVLENHRLVGMISEADVGRHLTDDQVAQRADRDHGGEHSDADERP